ncbi:hypothetical protein RHMOL_Rhmol10G0039200 [Rhododendron molle]|uniref:Uncharacterized protein n=1 Tax=Rhododendron molle TaxID=49168 RepID=A0ACC0M0E8_RHOML|nr:hypothetical protein RHMOL_Rhmol10G0039200 [Rhododendron molle]
MSVLLITKKIELRVCSQGVGQCEYHLFVNNYLISFYGDEEKRFYMLKLHRRHREIVNRFYLNHVMEGKAI